MKRNLFDELKEGFNALQAEREGTIILLKHKVKNNSEPTITPEELMRLREKLHLHGQLLPCQGEVGRGLVLKVKPK